VGNDAGKAKDDAKKRFVLAINTIALVAPQDVIAAIRDFVESTQKTNVFDQQKWNRVVLAARQDIGISSPDESDDVFVPLIGYSPSNLHSG
jgi:hypothetical protein